MSSNLRLHEHEVELTKVYSWHLAAWYLGLLGIVVWAATAFFSYALLKAGRGGYVLMVFGLLFGLYCFIKGWRYNRDTYWVLTNRRLIDFSSTGGIGKEVTSLPYSDMADVVVQSRGIGSAIWKYGTITVASAKGDEVYELERVRYPERVQHLLLEGRAAIQGKKEKLATHELYQALLVELPHLTEAQLLVLEAKTKELLDKR